jgi:glucokinase
MAVAKRSRSKKAIVGVDIGGTKMMAAVFDANFQKIGMCRKKSRVKNGGDSEMRVIKVIREAIENAGNPSIAGIGVGSPGPLDPATGVIIDTPNLGWKNFPLAHLLQETFKAPVVVDNDVNVGTYGEWRCTALRSKKHVLGVFPGTGIGGGIIIDGKILHGFSGAAGEVGHITIMPDGPFCGCGKRGCLEALASRVAIAKEVAALAAREDAPYILQHCGTDINAIRSGVLARAIEAGDIMVEQVVRKAAWYIGIGVGNLINVLSPEVVVLGGGLVEALETIVLEEVKNAVEEHAMPFLRKNVTIKAAELGDDAVVMGAAQLIHERITTGKARK